MRQYLRGLMKLDDGAETAEWLLIVGLLVTVGTVVYSPLSGLIAALTPIVMAAMSAAVGGP